MGAPSTLRKKILRISLAVACLLVAAGVTYYRIDGQPLPEASHYLQGEGYTARQDEDGSLLFTPGFHNGHGIVLLHGAVIKPLSYARTAAFFARKGYTVLLPRGPGRLSIGAVERAAARMGLFGVKDWYLIGHSMGGLASLRLLARSPGTVKAVALWASAIPDDHSQVTVPVLFIGGDRDGLLSPERMAQVKAHLPASTHYLTAAGGNHRGFALYSHQFFDGEATISQNDQIDFANEQTEAFFVAHP